MVIISHNWYRPRTMLTFAGEYDPRPLDVWGAAVVMLTICANGCLWTQAKMGASPAQPLYEDLVNGWAKWEAKHADDPKATISETDYPHVGFFDQHINPPALRRALLTMLNPNPTKRASIATIAKNRWLKNIECCQIDSFDDPSVIIDATKIKSCPKNITKVVAHNHLPPHHNFGHKFVRLPGSTDM
jgi:protein-serine/threonine kinase